MNPANIRSAMTSSLNEMLDDLQVQTFKKYTDHVIDDCLENLIELVNGHAVAVWLPEIKADQQVLTIAHNVGEKGPDIEGVISQPLEKGLVSKSFKENATVCHQGLFQHRDQSKDVDKALKQITAHQIAAPLKLFGKTVGAITVIQTLGAGIEQHSEWGFDKQDVRNFEENVEIVQRLFELNMIRQIG